MLLIIGVHHKSNIEVLVRFRYYARIILRIISKQKLLRTIITMSLVSVKLILTGST